MACVACGSLSGINHPTKAMILCFDCIGESEHLGVKASGVGRCDVCGKLSPYRFVISVCDNQMCVDYVKRLSER